MRYLYIALIVALVAIIATFKIQNLEAVTVTMLSFSMTMPTSLLVFLIYVLGMLTGGSLLALVRSLARGAGARTH
jgi:uncharacterized integral membrane protein